MKQIVVVCDAKSRKYGDYLAQLVSLSDDKENKIVGIKDGSVAVRIWNEKEYESQSVTISSEQYLVFIGDSKFMRDKRLHMHTKFSKFGMNYAWLGKQSALYVDRVVEQGEYFKFIDFAKEHEANIQNLIETKKHKKDQKDLIVCEKKKLIQKVVDPLQELKFNVENHAKRGINTVVKAMKQSQIKSQEYTCLILAFYLKGLNEFLTENE